MLLSITRLPELTMVADKSAVLLLLSFLSMTFSSPFSFPQLPSLLQNVVSGVATGGTAGVTTTTTVPVATTTTVPAMMAMAPMLPAVALGVVKALFLCEFRVDVRMSIPTYLLQPRL